MPPIKQRKSESLINGDVHDIILELRDNPFSFLQNHPKSGPDLIKILVMSTLELDRLYQLAWETDGADFPELFANYSTVINSAGSLLEQIADYIREYEEAIQQFNQQPDLRNELRLIDSDTDLHYEFKAFLESYGDEEIAAGELILEPSPKEQKLALFSKYIHNMSSDTNFFNTLIAGIEDAPQEDYEGCIRLYMFAHLLSNQGGDATSLNTQSREKYPHLFEQVEQLMDDYSGEWSFNFMTEEGSSILNEVRKYINNHKPEEHGL